MVSDGGGFMRGCAMDIPAYVASGPTGTGTWGWDFDGSYGDWYGGHELGHTYGRGHANFCGAGGGPSYPYAGGRISPSLTGNTALYGFDISTRADLWARLERRDDLLRLRVAERLHLRGADELLPDAPHRRARAEPPRPSTRPTGCW